MNCTEQKKKRKIQNYPYENSIMLEMGDYKKRRRAGQSTTYAVQ